MARSARRADLPIPQRRGRCQQPIDGVAQLGCCGPSGGTEVAFDVFDGACQDVQLVVQRVEFLPGHHEFVLAELEFTRPLTGDPVPLPASLGTEHPGSPGAATHRKCPSAPPAVRDRRRSPGTRRCSQFRHDVMVDGWLVRSLRWSGRLTTRDTASCTLESLRARQRRRPSPCRSRRHRRGECRPHARLR